MTLALIYVRQSRHKDYQRTVSPEVQEQACRALAAVKRCDSIEVFTDLDVSGGKRARRGYDALLLRIRAGGVEVVCAYDQSRAFRSTLIAAEFKALLEKPAHRSIEVALVHGTFDRSPVGGFSYAVLAAAHEMERKMTDEKVAAADRHLNAQGRVTGMAPYGYRRTPDGFAIDDQEAAVVRRLFEDYASGQSSSRALAATLNAEGVTKPGSRTAGIGWVRDTVVDLSQNVAFIGKTFSVSRARREGQLISATWPSIIDPDLFGRVQAILARNRLAGRGGARRGQTRSCAFAGLLTCEAWGRPMRAYTDRSGSHYVCRRDVAREQQCSSARRGVREARLVPWASILFAHLDAVRPADFDKPVAAASTRGGTPDAIAQVDRSLERQRKLFTWGHVSEADYLREAARLAELRDQLRGSLPTKRSVRIQGIRDVWERGGADARRQLLGTLFERLIVRDGQIVEYVPRADRVAEVIALVEQAIGPKGVVTVPQTEYGWRAKGRPRTTANGGKGGV